MSLSNNFPNERPSLNLDFARTKKLDPRITFVRTTTARYYDGKTVAKAEENLLLRSQEFNTNWVANNVTVTANAGNAPDGTATADLVYPTTTGNHRGVYQSVAATLNTNSKVLSIFAKASGFSYIFIQDAFDVSKRTWFDISTGTVGTTAANHTASIVDAGGGWWRCIVSTATSWNSPYFLVADADNSIVATANGTDGALFWGAQVELRTAVTAYTPTTTQPITNYIPVLLTAASGQARFDHNPTTGESLGLLIEEQRTNLLQRSQEFDNAYWSATNASALANSVVSPNGTITADTLIPNTSNAQHYFSRTITSLTSGSAYTISIYAKPAGQNWLFLYFSTSTVTSAYFNLSTGTVGTTSGSPNATITAVGNGWYKCTITHTASGTSASLEIHSSITGSTFTYTGNGYSGIYIWGAQLEAGSFPTSYIPTVASQETRNADAASMTGGNFSSWYNASEGTFYGEANSGNNTSLNDGTLTGRGFAVINDNSDSNRFRFAAQFNAFIVTTNGTAQTNIITDATIVANTNYKVAATYKFNDFAASRNGGSAVTDTSGIVPVVNQIKFGLSTNGNGNINGTIKKIAYYPERLTNAQLQALTSS